MLHKFFTIVLPLALPVLVYMLHVAIARQRGRMTRVPAVRESPWPWLLGSGVVLMAVALIGWRFAFGEGAEPGQVIRSPSYEDGELKPGGVEEGERGGAPGGESGAPVQ